MSLRELISEIARTYDRAGPMGSEAQLLLRDASRTMRQWVPIGYIAEGSGGKGNAATCPWIAVFDPDETTTAQHGMYVVYLFAADLRTVALSLNQGVTDLSKALGRKKARAALHAEAAAIRGGLDVSDIKDLNMSISLRTSSSLPRGYEHGNIIARVYEMADLPDESVMVSELGRFIRLYECARAVRKELGSRGTAARIVVPNGPLRPMPAMEFKPKSDEEYRQTIAAREIIKTRRHETLVREFGKFLMRRRFAVATNVHPRDLIAERDGQHWLIEAKTVYAGNGVYAARESLGQLLFYRRLLYDSPAAVKLLALFSEDIGAACVDLLGELGIATVWRSDETWVGSTAARDGGLAEIVS